jgi:hypothetical protein
MSDLVTIAIITTVGVIVTAVLKTGQDKIRQGQEKADAHTINFMLTIDGKMEQLIDAKVRTAHLEGMEEQRKLE